MHLSALQDSLGGLTPLTRVWKRTEEGRKRCAEINSRPGDSRNAQRRRKVKIAECYRIIKGKRKHFP